MKGPSEDGALRPNSLNCQEQDESMNTETKIDTSQSYTAGDYDRLGTMKKAADVVFTYFRWVLEDHRRTMVEKDHQAKITSLVHDVMAVFGFTDDKEPLARYFISNVLQGAQEAEFTALGREAFAPFDGAALKEIYDQNDVVSLLAPLSAQARCMYAGRFMAECTESYPELQSVDNAELIGCDIDLVQVAEWPILLEEFEIEDDGSFICVGKVIVMVREMTNERINAMAGVTIMA
jgi:hypothetical protein